MRGVGLYPWGRGAEQLKAPGPLPATRPPLPPGQSPGPAAAAPCPPQAPLRCPWAPSCAAGSGVPSLTHAAGSSCRAGDAWVRPCCGSVRLCSRGPKPPSRRVGCAGLFGAGAGGAVPHHICPVLRGPTAVLASRPGAVVQQHLPHQASTLLVWVWGETGMTPALPGCSGHVARAGGPYPLGLPQPWAVAVPRCPMRWPGWAPTGCGGPLVG